MTHRGTRLLVSAGAILLPVVLAPLLVKPTYAIGLVAAAAVVALAARNVAYPVALAGLPSVVIGLAGGDNPFPNGAIVLFGFAWIAVAVALAVLRDPEELPARLLFAVPVASTVLLTVWLLTRLAGSLDPSYGSHKLQLFVAGNLTLLVAGILVGRRGARFELWVFAALVLSLLGAVALARGLLAGQEATVGGRFSIDNANSPIGLGREAARGITLAVFVLLLLRASWLRALAFGALPVVAVALLASGSRGPLLGLAVGIATLLLLSAGDAAARRRLGFVLAAVAAAVVLVPQLVPGQDVGRALGVFAGGHGASSNGRGELWHEAWQVFSGHPLIGVGTGSFGAIDPIKQYPHDLLLEAAAELGVVGLLLVLALLASTFALLVRLRREAEGVDRAHVTLVAALFAAALVNALLSNDISGNEDVWLAAGLTLGLAHRLGLPSRRFDLAVSLAAFRRRRTPRTTALPPPRQGAAPDPGRILSPAPGAEVEGVVPVLVEPARTGRPVAAVRLEWRQARSWRLASEADERTYELDLQEGAAIVRSRALAESVAARLGAEVRLSARRPWSAWRRLELPLDTAALRAGTAELRSVTVDEDGTAVTAPTVEVVVLGERERHPGA